jgi:hypothetical protein
MIKPDMTHKSLSAIARISIACIFPITLNAQVPDLIGGPLGIERVAAQVGHIIGYRSPDVTSDASAWLQIDLGRNISVEQVKLFPDVSNGGWNGKANSRKEFPLRFKIETAKDGDEAFASPELYFDHTAEDCSGEIAHKVETFTSAGAVPTARYVRLTVTEMPEIEQGKRAFRLWRFEVIANGQDVSTGCTLSDSFKGNLGKHDLLRPRRVDGEFARFDHPENVTAPETWKPVAPALQTPRSGVTVGGFFGKMQERNEHYLLNGFTVNDLARDFLNVQEKLREAFTCYPFLKESSVGVASTELLPLNYLLNNINILENE